MHKIHCMEVNVVLVNVIHIWVTVVIYSHKNT